MATQKILLATDFAQQSETALDFAAYFAQLVKGEIVLMHVLEQPTGIAKMFGNDEVDARLQQQVQQLLTDWADRVKRQYNVAVSTVIEHGKPYDKIVEVATRIQPMFVLMGRSESHGKRAFVGSNALHVIEETKFPVITVNAEKCNFKAADKRNIILPLDFDKHVHGQIALAIAFAQHFGSEIKVLTVVDNDSPATEVKFMTHLRKAQKAIEAKGVKCQTTLLHDTQRSIQDIVLDFAHGNNAHLIVVMTQQKPSFIDHFIGSTAKAFIEKSDVPVLSVNPWEYESDSNVFSFIVDPLGVVDND